MPKSQNIRIALCLDDFYPHSSGVARSVEAQARELTRRGHNVVILAPKQGFERPDFCDSKALDSWNISGNNSAACTLKFSRRRAVDIAQMYQFDIIHSHNERGSLFLAAHIAKYMNIPHIHTFHTATPELRHASPFIGLLYSNTYAAIAPLLMRLIRHNPSSHHQMQITKQPRDWKNLARIATYTDAFTSPASYMIDRITACDPDILAQKAYVIPNGIDPIYTRVRRMREANATTRFITCGRLDPEKRIDTVIRAFAELKRDDAELYIIGSGIKEPSLRRLASQIVHHGDVVFLGHISDTTQIAQALADADCFVFASYHFDTQGLVLAEAAASGIGIIYCDDRLEVGVDAKNSLLVTPDVATFRTAMNTVCDDADLRKRMAKHSKEIGRKLTIETFETKNIALYEQLLVKHTSD